MEKSKRSEELRKWLKERPELSINQLEKKAGLPFTTLAKVKTTPKGHKARCLPSHHWDAINKVLARFGWNPNEQ